MGMGTLSFNVASVFKEPPKNHTAALQYRIGSHRCEIHLCREPLGTLYAREIVSQNFLVVSDTTVSAALNLKGESALRGHLCTIPAGESGKNWHSVDNILRQLLDHSIDREGTLYAIGGGALCDTAAFAAAIYMRGIRVVLIPTTLLCMVDASFGGKCGIDFGGYKNTVGSFHLAEKIYINLATLETLSHAEFHNGLAEVIKSALLGDETLFTLLRANRRRIIERDSELVLEVVQRSLAVKAAHVTKDYRDSGVRAHLNLGHTFAHALESLGGLREWSHGEAVGWGIAQAMKLGRRLGITDVAYARAVVEVLESYDFHTEIPNVDVAGLIRAMYHDKKRVGSALNFIVQRRLGETEMRAVDEGIIREVVGPGP